MAIEAVKAASVAYQGSGQAQAVESNADVSSGSEVEASTLKNHDTVKASKQELNIDGGKDAAENKMQAPTEALKKAVEEINKRATNSEAIFGIHDATNRVTIKIVNKDTKEVLREFPPEQTLDMIAKVWELAGLLVDEKR